MRNIRIAITAILFCLHSFVFGQSPQIFEEFIPWSGNTSTDGIWRKNGTWIGTGNNTMNLTNVGLNHTYASENNNGFLSLTSQANSLNGAEVQTLPSYGPGYYETRMKVTDVGNPVDNKGVCASFFFIKTNYGNQEFDFEFLTNESWITTTNTGKVHLTIHPTGRNTVLDLGFNPSLAFHKYGFLWQSGRIDFTVDGVIKYTFIDPTIDATIKGYIMMNSWTGNVNWGGNAPDQDATTVYDWVKFYPGITVLEDTIPKIQVTQIKLSKSNVSIPAGSTIFLLTSFVPSNANDQTFELKASDLNVVLVDQVGSITGLNPGICTVTATSTDGSKTAICTITVTAANTEEPNPEDTVTSILKPLNPMVFEVFPNPSSGKFKIEFNTNSSQNSRLCQVYNYFGMHITTLKEGEATLPKGMFLLRSGGFSKKLLIE